MRLTDISVRALKAPDHGQKTYPDDTLPGFGVRVSQGGTKTFVVVHGPTRERTTIGRFPIISLSDARTEAKRLLAEKTLGRRRAVSITYDDAKTRYLEVCAKKNRPRTVVDYTRLLGRFTFGKTRLADITKHDIARRLAKFSNHPTEYQHALVALKVFFKWAVRSDYLLYSPCDGLQSLGTPAARKHTLSPEELGEVLVRAIQAPYPYGPIVVLLILTGQRRGEIAHLEWEWFDRTNRTITLPETVTKNKREHTFPYGEMIASVLDSLPIIDNAQYLFPAARERVRGKKSTVFNGWSKAKAAFIEGLIDVAPFTLHDLRRTFSTHMAALGVEQIVVEKLLNHVSEGTQSPIAQVYNQYTYLAEMREAIDKRDQYLASLLKK